MALQIKIPCFAEIEIDLNNVNKDAINQIQKHLIKEIDSHQLEDWEGTITCTPEQVNERIMVKFEGDGIYTIYPGSPATSTDPGDPGSYDIPLSVESFLDYVKDLLKSFNKYDLNLSEIVQLEDCVIPNENTIDQALIDLYDQYDER